MEKGLVRAICIAPVARVPMQLVHEVEAIAGAGLLGDRYCTGQGSYSKNEVGRRQVTLMNNRFLELVNRGRGRLDQFSWTDCRRNIFTEGVELMWLIGREFQVGEATFRGIKYCEPCHIPSKVSGVPGFKEVFQDCGGLIAEIIKGGLIRTHDDIIPPPKVYS